MVSPMLYGEVRSMNSSYLPHQMVYDAVSRMELDVVVDAHAHVRHARHSITSRLRLRILDAVLSIAVV